MEVRGQKEIVIIALFDHLLMLPMNWICFCLQGFLAEEMRKSNSYLAHGAGKVLVQEVKPVRSWSSPVVKKFCTVLPITNQQQFSENRLRILYPCLTSVIRPETIFAKRSILDVSQISSSPLTTLLTFFYVFYEQQKNYITAFGTVALIIQLRCYLFKVNNRITRARREMCLKIIVRTPERRQQY